MESFITGSLPVMSGEPFTAAVYAEVPVVTSALLGRALFLKFRLRKAEYFTRITSFSTCIHLKIQQLTGKIKTM